MAEPRSRRRSSGVGKAPFPGPNGEVFHAAHFAGTVLQATPANDSARNPLGFPQSCPQSAGKTRGRLFRPRAYARARSVSSSQVGSLEVSGKPLSAMAGNPADPGTCRSSYPRP